MSLLEIKMSVSDAYTLGHMIRRDLMDNNPRVQSSHVTTADTLNEDTDGRLTIQMLPDAGQTAQAAYRESIQRLVRLLENLLNGPD